MSHHPWYSGVTPLFFRLATLAILLPFGEAIPSAAAAPSRYAFGLTMAQYLDAAATNAAQGYRPISLDANGPTNSPSLAVAWVNDGVTNWTTVLGLSRSQYSNQVASLTAQGFRTLCVDAYGDYPNENYVAVWVKDPQVGTGWAQVFGLSEADFGTAWNNYGNAGYRPSWISVIGTNGSPRFSGAWVHDGGGYWTYWNMSASGLTQNVTNLVASGGRPICFSGYGPATGKLFAGHWIYAEQPNWNWNSELTAAAFQTTAANLATNGYRPLCINEYGPPSALRYASTWVLDPPPKVSHVAGLLNTAAAPLDQEMTNYLALRNIERGTLAVTRNGKLVFHHSYTWAGTNVAWTQPTNLFRIASLSKAFTSVGILQLVQSGKLGIDQPISTILDLSSVSDPRFRNVTIRQLLQHWGGWDRNVAYDPMFRDATISTSLNRPLPTTPQMVLDYMRGQPLDHAPGTVYAYSNFGYSLLGRILEALSGLSYQDYMQANVLRPAGIWDMRLGKSLLQDADPAELDYEDQLRRVVPSVMGPGSPAKVPIQYGGWNISTMDAHGAWLATAADLVRFSSSFDTRTNSSLLPPELIDLMWSRPPAQDPNSAVYYGAGWEVRPLGGGTLNAWHDGSLDGTFSYTVRRSDGICWAVIFNRRDVLGNAPDYYNIDSEVNNAINQVSYWPDYDLFDANADGLLDAWQAYYFGSANSPNAAPTADPTGTGLSNLNAFINLTDPTKAGIGARLQVAADPADNSNLVLSWFAARGRLYTVETTTDLAATDWQSLPNVVELVGRNAPQSVIIPVSSGGYFRLNVRLQRP